MLKRQPGKTGCTAHAPPSFFHWFQNRAKIFSLFIPYKVKRFWRRL